jgi:hypothetical protein
MTILFDSKNLRKVTTFALGLFQVEAPAPKPEPATPTYDAQADDADSWGARFDAAQARYRATLRRPTKAETPTPAPVACDECSDDDCPGDDQTPTLPTEWPAEADADRWTVGPDIHPEKAPAPVSPRRRSSAPAPADYAWNLGYQLGREGRDAGPSDRMGDDEAAAFISGWDQGAALYRDEEIAAAEAYCRMLEQSNDPLDDIHDGELCEARMGRTLYQES